MGRKTPHLILLNLGTPESATEDGVRAFLAEFLADPEVVDFPPILWRPILHGMILRTRPRRVARQYAAIWDAKGSPLRIATDRMVAALRTLAGPACTVAAAYRYGEPSIATALREVLDDAVRPTIVVPLFPHRTGATTGTAIAETRRVAANAGAPHRVRVELLAPDDEGFVTALAERWRATMAAADAAPDHLVVSFHGIPIRYARRERNQYVEDCQATTRAFLQAIGWPVERATVAYQSRFGPERWLEPATAAVLEALPARGVRNVAVMAPGFLTEGLETLEELAIRGREAFIAAGGESFTYVPAVEDHPALMASLLALATRGATGAP